MFSSQIIHRENIPCSSLGNVGAWVARVARLRWFIGDEKESASSFRRDAEQLRRLVWWGNAADSVETCGRNKK